MTEREVLLWLDKSVGQARYAAYILSEINEDFAQDLEDKLHELASVVKSRMQRIARQSEIANASSAEAA